MRIVLFFLAVSATAQQKPNFSGNWTLNLDASDYSDARTAKPDKITIALRQNGDHFKYKWERQANGRKGSFDADVTVGGTPFESDAAGIVSMEWNGEALIVKTLFNPGQERQSDQEERWTLSNEGKRLTDDLVIHPPQNGAPVHVVRVFDKQ
jgi:hypothetical protein